MHVFSTRQLQNGYITSFFCCFFLNYACSVFKTHGLNLNLKFKFCASASFSLLLFSLINPNVHDRSSLARSSTTLTSVRAASLPTVVESLEMEDIKEVKEVKKEVRRRIRSCSGVKCQV